MAIAALLLALAVAPTAVNAQLLPAGFFEQVPPMGGKAQVEADMLSYDAGTSTISAEGDVVLHYEGYDLTADKVTFNQKTGEVFAEGNVGMRDPSGNVYTAERVEITDELKRGFVRSLTLTTPEGAQITADSVDYAEELQSILTNATYSPCGLCIDDKSRRIGWKVRASKITYDKEKALVFLEGAGLEVLGVPIAWIPWFVLPDPSQPRKQGFRLPSVGFDAKYGLRVNAPYFVPLGEDIDLLLTPTLLTRQGFLMAAEMTHRVPIGEYNIKASGLYQLDPGAYAGTVGNTNWRGALQTTGRFQPIADWTVGWSYTAFTDSAYLKDYGFQSSDDVVNEIYATYLTRDTFFDVRARQHQLLGNFPLVAQQMQALSLPRLEAWHYINTDDYGQFRLSANLDGIRREADHTATVNGVPYVFGYEENKAHLTLEGAWQKQIVLPAGLLATPYLGGRLDAGYYDGASALLAGPISLLEATPIAAIDVRWPLIATSGGDSHVFEPIAQLVYRGSSTTQTGITNDNAQSFVFDDTRLFDYNRFSGTDRQETGLRANVGGRYQANFEDGSWLELMGGESFHLAGVNGLGVIDTAQTGNSTGLGTPASYIVLGAKGSPGYGLDFGAKAQIDPYSWTVRRAGVAGGLNLDNGYSFGAAYTYIAANPAIGTLLDQHEATLSAAGPLPWDYWYADASVSWDLASNTWLEAGGGINYDDKYFVVGAFGKVTGPTHSTPNSTSFGLKFRLRGPDGEWGF